jgi:carbon-monoxide dehydrogenase large subunit
MKEPQAPDPGRRQGALRRRPVALVVAETLEQAKDAAELIEVDYDELPPVVDPATRRRRRQQCTTSARTTACYHWGIGDKAGTDAASRRRARHDAEFRNNRLIPNAMEPRAANASYNPQQRDSYTLYVANQNPHVERLLMCAFVLGIPEHKMRVVAPDVGGGFGSKIFLYGEETALVWAPSNSAARSSGPASAASPSCPTPTAATT